MAQGSRISWRSLAVIVVFAAIASPAVACQYCRQGGDPKDCLDQIKADRSGERRLELAIDQFQGASIPAPMTVATTAADLPKPALKRAARPAAPVVVAASPVTTSHAVDGALASLAGALGIFFWRTGRPAR